MYALAGKPIRSMPFEYEFGTFQPGKSSGKRSLVDIGELRSRLGRFENPIQHLSSAGLGQFQRLTEFDPLDFAKDRLKFLLERHDFELLENYLQRRLALIRRKISLNKRLSKIKKTSGEILQIVDTRWLQPFHLGDEALDEDDNSQHEIRNS